MKINCAMKGCLSVHEFAEGEAPSKDCRYICSQHSDSELMDAGILRTARTDKAAHFQDFSFDRALKGRGNHRYTHPLPEHPEMPGNYAYDDDLSRFGIQVSDAPPEGMTDVPVEHE